RFEVEYAADKLRVQTLADDLSIHGDNAPETAKALMLLHLNLSGRTVGHSQPLPSLNLFRQASMEQHSRGAPVADLQELTRRVIAYLFGTEKIEPVAYANNTLEDAGFCAAAEPRFYSAHSQIMRGRSTDTHHHRINVFHTKDGRPVFLEKQFDPTALMLEPVQ